MPVVMYSEDEFESMTMELNRGAMRLAQALCEAKGFPCIRGPNNSVDGPGDYCDGCPAHEDCPFDFKREKQA